MSWITVSWSMLASVSLTFALLHLFIWAKGLQPWSNLSFSVAAVAAAFITGMELMIMRGTTIEQVAMLLRWVQLPVFVLSAAIFCFVRCYFDTGRSWLFWMGISLRLLALIQSFTTGQNLFFKEVTRLKQVEIIGGETISIAQGTINPWYVVGPLSVLVLVAFVLDAAVTLWRGGTDIGRRRAIVFSSSIIFFLLTAPVHAMLVNAGIIDSPYLVGLSFMPILLAMSYELSCGLLHTAKLARQLQTNDAELRISKQRMKLAASAAELRLWEWDIVHDEIWSTDKDYELYGITEEQKISFDRFLNVLYKEDRDRVRRSVEKALTKGNGHYESEYRIKMADGQIHWLNSRGRIDFSKNGQPLRMLGVTIDITRRKLAELALQQQRNELAHLSRVITLGELSGSLAHELNQPLAAILSNAQAAQRFLARDKSDLAEIQDILKDIVSEDKRAVEIIQRLRLLLKKGEVQYLQVNLNETVEEVLKIVNSDLVNHNITVTFDPDQQLPWVMCDRVQLQQVLLNLFMNAIEAMCQTDAGKRHLSIRTERNGVDKIQVSVSDQGSGIPSENLQSIFEPFFSTKSKGMGLGLPICRNIITAHGGQLWATNNQPSGSTFYFRLPISRGESA